MASATSILIIGSSSFVGSSLALRFGIKFKVMGTNYKNHFRIENVTQVPINITNKDQMQNLIFTFTPSAIIYSVAINDAAECAKNRQVAEAINAFGALNSAEIADKVQAKFIYLSCAAVYDGQKSNYDEDATIFPLTDFGRTKLAGENLVRSRCLNHVILRLPYVYGFGTPHNSGVLGNIRRHLEAKETLQLDGNDIHSFLYINDLADIIENIIKNDVRNRVLNIETPTITSMLQFGRSFAGRFGYNENLLVPMVRPKDVDESYNYSLKSKFMKELAGLTPRDSKAAFEDLDKFSCSPEKE